MPTSDLHDGTGSRERRAQQWFVCGDWSVFGDGFVCGDWFGGWDWFIFGDGFLCGDWFGDWFGFGFGAGWRFGGHGEDGRVRCG